MASATKSLLPSRAYWADRSLAFADDNVGANAKWIYPATEAEIVNAYPRLGWTKCFGDAMKDEVANKPWRSAPSLNRPSVLAYGLEFTAVTPRSTMLKTSGAT